MTVSDKMCPAVRSQSWIWIDFSKFFRCSLSRVNEWIAERGKAMVIEAIARLPEDESDDPDDDAGNQLSLDNFVKPADWPEGKPWGILTIDASCTPADITYPTDLKLLNEARESTERIIDDLCEQQPDLRKHKPRYDRGKARAVFLNVAKQKKPRWSKIKASIRRQLDYLQRNIEAIDALIASGAALSSLKTHWWHKLLVISELHASKPSRFTLRRAASLTASSIWCSHRFDLWFAARQELLLSLGLRSVFLCGMVLRSCIGSAGIHAMRPKI